MTSSRLWVLALDRITADIPNEELLGWLLALKDRTCRRILSRIIIRRQASSKLLTEKVDLPKPLADFVVAFAVKDRNLKSLPLVIDQVIHHLFKTSRGSAINLRVATEMTSEQHIALLKTLDAALPQPVVMHTTTEKSLIGGGMIHIGSKAFNLSTASRLVGLRRALA